MIVKSKVTLAAIVAMSNAQDESDQLNFEMQYPYQKGGVMYKSEPPEYILNPVPASYLTADDLPDSYDIRNVDGINYASTDRTQHHPQYCGACWAFSTTAALSDRIALARGGRFPEVLISPGLLLTCDKGDNGCGGGSAGTAYRYMHKHGITDQTCSPFKARG